MRAKSILKEFGDRYATIEHDGGYLLYDKERECKRANAQYLGHFTVSQKGKMFQFQGELYDTVSGLVAAMDKYNATLPFAPEIYDPLYRKHHTIKMALYDYLVSLGFLAKPFGKQYSLADVYSLADAYGQPVITLTVKTREDTTEGKVCRNINGTDRWAEAEFTDLDSAVGAVNTIVAPYCVLINALSTDILRKLTASRVANMTEKSVDLQSLSVFSEDAMAKAIALLEKELENLRTAQRNTGTIQQ